MVGDCEWQTQPDTAAWPEYIHETSEVFGAKLNASTRADRVMLLPRLENMWNISEVH